MKNESLNGVLTFVLGVLVVLGVIFALRVFFTTREIRTLQSQVAIANTKITQARALLGATDAYNRTAKSPELQRILQSLQTPSHQ